MVDALHAVGALFHHAAAPHRDVRVPQRVVALGVPVGVEQEVEAANLVRTVVRTVAGAHAAVVDHVVQAFRAVRGRGDRAHHLARRVFALLTRHRLVDRLHRLGCVDAAREVVVDADPVHLAVDVDLRLADDRDVVLGDARDDAGATAGARREVDRHAPLVAGVLVVRVERERLRKRVGHVRDDRRLVRVLRERDHARRMPAFHGVVILGRREQIPIAGLDDLEAGAEPGRVRRAQPIGVERLGFLARGADASGHAAAVTEKHGDRLIGLARHDEDRHAGGDAAIAQLDDVAAIEALFFREPRADPRGGVPRQFRERFRCFLEPAVVGEAPVPHCWIGPEDEFESRCRGRRCQRRRRCRRSRCGRHRCGLGCRNRNCRRSRGSGGRSWRSGRRSLERRRLTAARPWPCRE